MALPPNAATELAKTRRGSPLTGAQGFQNVAAAVQVHVHGEIEVQFPAAADDRGEMKDGNVVAVDQLRDGSAVADITDHGVDGEGRIGQRGGGVLRVEQDEFIDRLAGRPWLR